MNAHLETLEPHLVWQHFRMFADTPRPSWSEAAILERIIVWADARGFVHERDRAGNLLIRKPASPGHEQAPTIALQGHVDMVAEADTGVRHDFATDAIATVIEDGWVKARGTTLGADNGIGAAAALAILDENELPHGPLEVLLTIAEEVSLVGASRLAPGWLNADMLLNLDTEEEGEVCIGCAGGANVTTETDFGLEPVTETERVFTIEVAGLTGGHSGMDIATGRASANVLLARALHALGEDELRLVAYDGGRMDNAITRRAGATIALPATSADTIDARLAKLQATFREELAGVDTAVTLDHGPGDATQALRAADSGRVVRLLRVLPYGAARMSLAAPGVVETSNNIGVIQLHDGVFTAQIMVRSLIDSARDALAERIALMFELAGLTVTRERGYPGWTPNSDSKLLARFRQVHAQVTGTPPAVMVVHAGLECGLIGAKYPEMDMISFGPTIRGAHSPTERVDIAAVAAFYDVLKATIADLAHVPGESTGAPA